LNNFFKIDCKNNREKKKKDKKKNQKEEYGKKNCIYIEYIYDKYIN